MPDLDRIDLTDLDLFTRGFPHAVFDRLRAEAPVFWHRPTRHTPDGEGFWVVSRHADVLGVFLDPETYSSVTGGERPYGGTFLQDVPFAGVMFNMMDDPRHARIRTLINRGFTPRHIGALEAELRQRAAAIFDGVIEREGAEKGGEGSCEFVREVARELPLQAICMLLGVPQADRGMLCDWVDIGLEHEDRDLGQASERSAEANAQLSRYAQALVEEKRARPGDDVLSVVMDASLPDQSPPSLTHEELVQFFFLLITAGSETTRKAIAGGLLALFDEPEQMRWLRAQRTLPGSAVEEIVRWTTPSVYKRRTVTRDHELHGQKLRAGDKLTIWEMSANRDERAFADPHRFDVRRHPNPHLGFGQGVHYCLGANLARLEIRVLFDELFRRTRSVELDGEPVWTRDNRLFGLKRLPVAYEAR